MNYREKALKASQEAHKKQVAVKLLDGIDKIVLEATELSARRWVWELMQNAKDVANEKVQIEIELGHNFVEFRHNGNPFEMEHLTYLIEQISTKERRSEDEINEKKTTGQFGTGFMTTHLLSKIVDLEGILLDKDTRVHKNFVLRLDRSATTIEGMKKNVDLAFEVFDRLDNDAESPALENYTKNQECDTKFRYLLDEKSLEIAKKGIEDLYASLPYTLVFLPQIEAVKIITKDSTDVYKNSATVPDGVVSISEIKSNSELIYIAHLSDNEVDIAIQLGKFKDKYFIEKPNVSVPTLFCDFPLIGSETFTFPVIVNSRYFYPTEPRDGIYLSEKDDFKINQNKELMVSAKDLYLKLLEHASQHWSDTLWLARTHLPENIDTEWFKENIQKPMREVLLKTAIVENQKGEFIYLKKNNKNDTIAFFPFSDDNQIREKIWFFYKDIYPQNPPKKEHINHWYEIIWDDCNKKTIGTLTNNVKSFKNISGLAKQLSKNESNAFIWLNDFIRFIEENEPNLLDEFAVLPNQYGDFIFKKDLNIDEKIPKELKEVLAKIGEDWKLKLLDTNVNCKVGKELDIKDISTEIDRIIDINENFRITEKTYDILKEKHFDDIFINKLKQFENKLFSSKINFETELVSILGKVESDKYKSQIFTASEDTQMRSAVYDLISLYPKNFEPEKKRTEIWKFAKDLDGNVPQNEYSENPTDNLIPELWNKADNWLLKKLILDISEFKTTKKLKEKLPATENEILWLNNFFAFFVENEIVDKFNINEKNITPNQKGEFKKKTDLYFDNSIPEKFKDVLEIFDEDNDSKNEKGWRYKLLNPEITAFNSTEKTKLKILSVKEVSDDISLIIKGKDHNQSKNFRKAVFLLSSCFAGNDDKQRRTLWQFAKDILVTDFPEQIEIKENISDFDWSECNTWLVKYLITEVSYWKSSELLQNKLNISIGIYEWLNSFVSYILEFDKNLLNIENYPVIPNYFGDFHCEKELFLDDGSMEDELKEVLLPFRQQWLSELLNQKIELDYPENKIRTLTEICKEIDDAFRTYKGSEQDANYVKSFRILTNYFDNKNNEEFIKENFNWIHENLAKISVSIIGDNKKRAAIFRIVESDKMELLSKIAESNLTDEDLEDLALNAKQFKEYKEWKRNPPKSDEVERIKQLVIRFGFSTIDELEAFVENKGQSRKRESHPVDMYAIQESNKRAKDNVKAKLKNDNRYTWNDNDVYEETNTIIKGVKKFGEPITLVIKGADKETVYFSKDERTKLIEPNAELWINNVDKPKRVSIGELLEKYKIDYMNVEKIYVNLFEF